MDNLPMRLFSDFTALKATYPEVQFVVALGGWAFNDNGDVIRLLPIYCTADCDTGLVHSQYSTTLSALLTTEGLSSAT